MRTGTMVLCGALIALGWAHRAAADVWDTQTVNDDSVNTHNELVHGSNQLHDLGAHGAPAAADVDWYTISTKPWASYEVVVDATSGDINAPVLELRSSDGMVLIASGVPIGNNFSQSLRWQNVTSNAVSHRIKVASGGCTTDCGSDDVYRIRAYETSYGIARFNNYLNQVTILLVQNAATYSINGNIYFWSDTGTLLATQSFLNLLPKALLNINAAAIPGLAGVGGSITIAHTGRYGDLTGKAVSLDPSTGLAFDTPMMVRPN